MKRWLVLLIVFALMGGMIVMSGCTADDFAECFWVCTWNSIVDCPEFCGSYCGACFVTCFDCSYINNLECNGDPIQFCVDCGCAFSDACITKRDERTDSPES